MFMMEHNSIMSVIFPVQLVLLAHRVILVSLVAKVQLASLVAKVFRGMSGLLVAKVQLA